MGGFNTLVRDFNTATCEMHLASPDGLPAYAVYRGESVDIATGTWKTETKKDRTEKTAVPPAIKGAEVKPCYLLIRSPASPDARRFREERDCTLDFSDITGTKRDAGGNIVEPDEAMARVWWGSFIAGFKNLPYEDEKTKETKLAEYDEETALKFIDDMPGIVLQMQRILFDVKNFGRPLQQG